MVGCNYKDESGESKRTQYEIDFAANKNSKRHYIQSALNIDTEDKKEQETKSLNKVRDSFKKIVIVKDNIVP